MTIFGCIFVIVNYHQSHKKSSEDIIFSVLNDPRFHLLKKVEMNQLHHLRMMSFGVLYRPTLPYEINRLKFVKYSISCPFLIQQLKKEKKKQTENYLETSYPFSFHKPLLRVKNICCS